MKYTANKEIAFRWILKNASLNDFTAKRAKDVYDGKVWLPWGKANVKTLRGMCEWLSEGHTMFPSPKGDPYFMDEFGKEFRMEFFHEYFKGSTIDFAKKYYE